MRYFGVTGVSDVCSSDLSREAGTWESRRHTAANPAESESLPSHRPQWTEMGRFPMAPSTFDLDHRHCRLARRCPALIPCIPPKKPFQPGTAHHRHNERSTMATWSDLSAYIHSNYKIAESVERRIN